MPSASPQPSRRRTVAERAVVTAGVTAFFVLGYFVIGLATDPARARGLATPLDAAIPFAAWTVWIYLGVFPTAYLPLFVVRSPRLFRRTMLSYLLAMTASYAIFVLFPVTSTGLRVAASRLDASRFSDWAVAVLYRLDPPYNLFPSLHLSIATLAAAAAFKADRRIGIATAVGVALIGVSICTVKQHFVLDGLGGVALAAAVGGIVLRPFRPAPGEPAAYAWPGWAAFLGVLAAVYAGFGIAFLATR